MGSAKGMSAVADSRAGRKAGRAYSVSVNAAHCREVFLSPRPHADTPATQQ